MKLRSDDTQLHEASMEHLERRVMDLALDRTGAKSGAIFLWDAKKKGLALGFHIVDGVVIQIPDALVTARTDGRPSGVAMHVYSTGDAHLVSDTAKDRYYAPYFLDVGSIAAVPIVYGRHVIGVLSVSAREKNAFTQEHIGELEALAGSATKFLRRAQLYRASRAEGRPFLMKGLSPEWLEVERRIEHVSSTNAAVLVTGESGTGKELVAHAIHFNSRRAQAPFVTVNCAAIPEQMLESVLFGHVRGAFTGASFDKVGEMKKAHGGTLFLDELGELPMSLQPKVLRALESGEIQPLGSNRSPERVDVRLVCATNRDLPKMVRERTFRDDLYYRLGVMTIELPPLRSYKQQIELLANVFREIACERIEKEVPQISRAAITALAAYDFPGNMRELRNAIEHAVILADHETIEPQHLPRSIAPTTTTTVDHRPSTLDHRPSTSTLAEKREEWLAPLEASYLSTLMAQSRGSVRDAAKRAGVDTVTLYRLLRKRGISFGRSAEIPGS
ncbi:MAG: sigma-54-dependent Fis family transcriptional regulator [Polyangiaceae bacterium]